jgi:hypothetical protein
MKQLNSLLTAPVFSLGNGGYYKAHTLLPSDALQTIGVRIHGRCIDGSAGRALAGTGVLL